MKEALGDTIRIFLLIDMLVVHPVFAGPEEGRVFEGARAKDQSKKAHAPMGLESQMREQSMVAYGNRESAGEEHDKEESDLEPVNPKEAEISGHRGERQE
jgi:hypothetical protein